MNRQGCVPVVGDLGHIGTVRKDGESRAGDAAGVFYTICNINADGSVCAQCIDVDHRVVVLIEVDVALQCIIRSSQRVILDLHVPVKDQPRIGAAHAHSAAFGGDVVCIRTVVERCPAGVRKDRSAVDRSVVLRSGRRKRKRTAVQIDRAALALFR